MSYFTLNLDFFVELQNLFVNVSLQSPTVDFLTLLPCESIIDFPPKNGKFYYFLLSSSITLIHILLPRLPVVIAMELMFTKKTRQPSEDFTTGPGTLSQLHLSPSRYTHFKLVNIQHSCHYFCTYQPTVHVVTIKKYKITLFFLPG